MTKVDLIALGFVALTAFIGWKKGLISTALSLVGIVLGAWLGSRLAPELLQGGKNSPYTPLAALVGAAVGAILLETLGTLAGSALRSRVRRPKLTTFDATGGLVLGTLSGLAIVWVLGAVALLLPGQTDLRRGAQSSALLQRLNQVVSPTDVLDVLARIDPFPTIAGPAGPVAPPDPRLARAVGVRRASPSVVRVLGTACDVGVEGTGWAARPDLVVTAAHVVAGQKDTVVELQSGGRLPADVVAFDPRNDVAVLRVGNLGLRGLPLATAQGRHSCCRARISRERPLYRHSRPDRSHFGRARRRCVRVRPGHATDHRAPRARSARRLRCARRQLARCRRGDGLRSAHRRGRGLRRSDRCRQSRSRFGQCGAGLDRQVRSLAQQLEHAQRAPERRDEVDAGGALPRRLDQLARVLKADVRSI